MKQPLLERLRGGIASLGVGGWRFLIGLFSALPLVGQLVETDRKHISSSFKELLWTTVAATLPIWLFPLFAMFIFRDGQNFATGVLNSIAQGDLYIYSAAIVGPLMFALTTNYAEWDSDNRNAPRIGRLTFLFPYGTWFTVISLAVVVVSAFCFGFIRYHSMGLIDANLNIDILVNLSILVYVITNFCMYLVAVYRNALMNVAGAVSGDEREFVRRFLKERDSD